MPQARPPTRKTHGVSSELATLRAVSGSLQAARQLNAGNGEETRSRRILEDLTNPHPPHWRPLRAPHLTATREREELRAQADAPEGAPSGRSS